MVYVCNGNEIKLETIIDAVWKTETQDQKFIDINETPVVQHRQNIDLTVFTKAYTAVFADAWVNVFVPSRV